MFQPGLKEAQYRAAYQNRGQLHIVVLKAQLQMLQTFILRKSSFSERKRGWKIICCYTNANGAFKMF